MKIITIVGARPQFVKAAMVSRAIQKHNNKFGKKTIEEIIIHTGQHYDNNMSRIFFDQMKIPHPKYNLAVGSGTHGETTGRMLAGIEEILFEEKPDWVLVYGDTNSTLAGALAASKLHIPVAHVEAGLRSFNRKMPEEINRIITDHVSSLLLCPTITAVNNLRNEGITNGVHHVGDVMYDAALIFGEIADKNSTILDNLNIKSKSYYLATIHRAENTDNYDRLRSIFFAFVDLATEKCPIIMPLHPRTIACIEREDLKELIISNPSLRMIEPVSFIDMVMLEKHAKVILTDSGGVQKEAYFHRIPCVTLRDETEWVETVLAGCNTIVGVSIDFIITTVKEAEKCIILKEYPPVFGKGDTAETICRVLAL